MVFYRKVQFLKIQTNEIPVIRDLPQMTGKVPLGLLNPVIIFGQRDCFHNLWAVSTVRAI